MLATARIAAMNSSPTGGLRRCLFIRVAIIHPKKKSATAKAMRQKWSH
jgi:hypothetical protein